MNIDDLNAMVELGILQKDGDEFAISPEFLKRFNKLKKNWTTSYFTKAVTLNKQVRGATTPADRLRIVLNTNALISFFIEKGELVKMMKRNDLTLKKRLADYCNVIDCLMEEQHEKVS